jgi:hypothetical protein
LSTKKPRERRDDEGRKVTMRLTTGFLVTQVEHGGES